jgi:hypothetical protein
MRRTEGVEEFRPQGEAKADLFGNIQNVVTGKMSAADAVAAAIALN